MKKTIKPTMLLQTTLISICFAGTLFAAETVKTNKVNEELTKEVQEAYSKATQLQRVEKKPEEAKQILEVYGELDGVPDKVRRQIFDYKTWLYWSQKEYDKSHVEFQRMLSIDVPDGFKTIRDVSYGPYARNKMDLYLPEGVDGPTPVLVYIHGGGWLHGDGSVYALQHRADVSKILANGGAVASITYRLTKEDKLPAPLLDAARAIQFLRYNAKKYNLDTNHIVVRGDSAGGCSSLWLATHDDLADPKAKDPVLRESTRVSGAIGDGPQTTLDPVVLKEGDIIGALNHAMFSIGLDTSNKELLAGADPKVQEMIDFCSPVKHLDANDPVIVMNYSGPISRLDNEIHHPKLGLIFQKRADEVGAKSFLYISKEKDYPAAKHDYMLKMLGLK